MSDNEAMHIHPDVLRKAALDEWQEQLDVLGETIAKLKKLSRDSRLFAEERDTLPIHSPDAMSTFTACSLLNDSLPRFALFHGELQVAGANVTEIRNRASFRFVPIHRLPHELLRDIFLLATFGYDEPAHGSSFLLQSTLVRVCRHWRDIIGRCGIFWTFIDFGSVYHAGFDVAVKCIERAAAYHRVRILQGRTRVQARVAAPPRLSHPSINSPNPTPLGGRRPTRSSCGAPRTATFKSC
jgi:hypothetical protein